MNSITRLKNCVLYYWIWSLICTDKYCSVLNVNNLHLNVFQTLKMSLETMSTLWLVLNSYNWSITTWPCDMLKCTWKIVMLPSRWWYRALAYYLCFFWWCHCTHMGWADLAVMAQLTANTEPMLPLHFLVATALKFSAYSIMIYIKTVLDKECCSDFGL